MKRIVPSLFRLTIVLYIVAVGFAMIFLVPPLQKPDEGSHFLQVLRLRNGIILCNKTTVTNIPKDYYDLLNNQTLQGMQFHPERKLPTDFYNIPLFTARSTVTNVPVNISILCTYPIISYIPQTIGVWLGDTMGLGVIPTFFLGRLSIFLVCLIWFLYLWKKTPAPWNLAILFPFLLPMTLHQLSSYSYDAIHIMIGFTVFSVLIQAYFNKQIRYAIRYIAALIILFLSRHGGYEPLVFSILLLPKQVIQELLRHHKRLLTVLLFLLFIALISSKLMLQDNTQTQALLSSLTQSRISLLQKDPLIFISALFITTKTLVFPYMMETIGIFGWLEYGIPHFAYILYLLIGVGMLIEMIMTGKMLLNRFQQILLGLILIASYIYIHFIIYLVWPKQIYFIEGVQGRYFIVFIPFIFLLISQIIGQRISVIHNKIKQRYFLIIPYFFSIFIGLIVVIIRTIIFRYFF